MASTSRQLDKLYEQIDSMIYDLRVILDTLGKLVLETEALEEDLEQAKENN